MKELCAATRGSRAITIALIDGAPDLSHPSLTGASIEVVASANAGPSPASSAHATFIASMLVGCHPDALGLCPDCRLLVIAAVDDQLLTPSTPPLTVARRLARAFEQCRSRGAHIVQVSLELGLGSTPAAHAVRGALASLTQSGLAVVMATGHGTLRLANELLSVPGVIPVSAADEDGHVRWDERLGSLLSLRGMAAPGTRVPGAVPPDGFGLRTGSSYAATFVTATLALIMARRPSLLPAAAASQLVRGLPASLSAARPPYLDASRLFADAATR